MPQVAKVVHISNVHGQRCGDWVQAGLAARDFSSSATDWLLGSTLAAGLTAALCYVCNLGVEQIAAWEAELLAYA